MASKKNLSVVLITMNEADRVRRCLESVKELADEIIVLDSGSTDGTLEILREYTDNVFQTDWPGFGIQKQRALDKAAGDWVLSIDADEALDPELQRWMASFIQGDRGNVTAAKLPWGVVAYGKLLNYGRSARAPLRLVWRDGARFTDAEVHEELVPAPGDTITAKGRLLHYSHRDYGHALQKNRDYAWLGAQKYFRNGRRCNSLAMAMLRAGWTFFQVYLLRLGVLDGPVGFLMAMTYAQNNFNKYAGLWTLTRAEKMARAAI